MPHWSKDTCHKPVWHCPIIIGEQNSDNGDDTVATNVNWRPFSVATLQYLNMVKLVLLQKDQTLQLI